MSSESPTAALWAKTSRSSPGLYHPLLCHMIDTAMVARSYWRTSLPSAIRGLLSEMPGLTNEEAGGAVAFWAGLHDIGKASPVFQTLDRTTEWRSRLKNLRFHFGLHCKSPGPLKAHERHEAVSAYVLCNEQRVVPKAVAMSLGAHHGTFTRSDIVLDVSRNPDCYGEHESWRLARSEIIEKLQAVLRLPGGNGGAGDTPDPSDEALILLTGFVTVCDWIASSEDFFPFEPDVSDFEEYAAKSAGRAAEALESLGWRMSPRPKDELPFQGVFPSIDRPRPLQETIEALFRQTSGCEQELLIVEAPMGEGKTEAALYVHDVLEARGRTSGCYVALPTQATSNQMFARVGEYLRERAPGVRTNLHLLHAGSILSDVYRELRLRALREPDTGHSDDGLVAEEWFVPKKRALLAPYGVGTIDQALLSVLQTRHYYLRLFGLAGKTVILDEVHAYDTYMSTLLDRLLFWLRRLGASVIVLSATLPSVRRQQLIEAWAEEKKPPARTTYPRLTRAGKGGSVQSCSFEARRMKPLSLEWVEGNDGLAGRMRDLLSEGGCGVCIRNTVDRAQRTYESLKATIPDTELTLFHARFPLADRARIEERVKRLFGKGCSDRPRRAVLVATQVVEQSLDLDFDVMFSDLAPVDLVLQRAGRLHRHPEHDSQRPPSVASPRLFLMRPSLDPNGLPLFGDQGIDERIYHRHMLLRSWLALQDRDRIEMPTGIEELVEWVYGQETPLTMPEALQMDLESSRQDWLAERARLELQARSRAIPEPSENHDILWQFNWKLEEDDPDLNPDLQALTRLGPPSIQIVCLHEMDGVLYLDAKCSQRADLSADPDSASVRELLQRSLSLSHKSVYCYFRDRGETPWTRSAPLRHHRLARFRGGICEAGKTLLRLDAELGVVIDRSWERNLSP